MRMEGCTWKAWQWEWAGLLAGTEAPSQGLLLLLLALLYCAESHSLSLSPHSPQVIEAEGAGFHP